MPNAVPQDKISEQDLLCHATLNNPELKTIARDDKKAQDEFIKKLCRQMHMSINKVSKDPIVRARIAKLAADLARPRWSWFDIEQFIHRSRQRVLHLHRVGEVIVFEVKM